MGDYGISRNEYTNKWGNLRGQFLQDHNRHFKSKQSGASADYVFHSTWKWYTHLSFLKTGEELLNESTETDLGMAETNEIGNYKKKQEKIQKKPEQKKEWSFLKKVLRF